MTYTKTYVTYVTYVTYSMETTTTDTINHLDFINSIINASISTEPYRNVVSCTKCVSNENDLTITDGYVICSLCGTVLSNRVSDMVEWNTYTDTAGTCLTNSRCGSIIKTTEINPFANNLFSFVPKGTKNVYYKDGKPVNYDLSKMHIKNNSNHLQKSFSVVENYLENVAENKYSKCVVVTAKTLWGEIMKSKKVTRAGVREGLIACCLYYSCVHYGCVRSPIEICKDFGMSDTKNFNKGDKEFKETFENNEKWSYLLTKTSNPDEYFSRFCSELEIKTIIKEHTAFKFANECRTVHESVKSGLNGLSPKSIACGIICWVIKKNKTAVTKVELLKILGICSPTLSKTYQSIVDIIGKP